MVDRAIPYHHRTSNHFGLSGQPCIAAAHPQPAATLAQPGLAAEGCEKQQLFVGPSRDFDGVVQVPFRKLRTEHKPGKWRWIDARRAEERRR